MFKHLSKLYNRFRPKTQAELEYEYLCEATDLVDLEFRIRKLDRQRNPNLVGWV